MQKRLWTGLAALMAVCTLMCGGAALAADAIPAKPAVKAAPAAPKTEAAPAEEAPARDPKAMEILLRMANYLAKAPALQVTVLSSYDAIQEDGQFIEFSDRRRIELQRPEQMRIDVERSDGDKGEMRFDGKAISVFKPAENFYALVEKPGTIDAALVYVVKDLQIPVPLARLFTSTFPQQMEKLVTSIDYVETNRLFDVPTDHLAVRSEEVDFQVWIAQGDAPFPRRVIITYKNADGEPQYQALLSDWSMTAVDAGRFAFTPPTGAEKIPLLIPKENRRPSAAKKEGAK